MTTELSTHKLFDLDDKFEEFQHVNDLLAEREFQIRYPWRESDQNIGGGKSAMPADVSQKVLETIEQDKRMIYLQRLKTAGTNAEARLTKAQRQVYEIRYQSPSHVGWPELPEIINRSRGWVYNCRYTILECLAKELGYLS